MNRTSGAALALVDRHSYADAPADRASRLEARVRALTAEPDARTGSRRVIGDSPEWTRTLTHATQVAATETTVLLLGESGTGKEVVARYLHRASPRHDGPFVALNCAALPEQLLEAELFGYERGAYTGATQSKPGQLEQAAGGTLFLDEVAEMSLSAQAKLLRVLQEREFQRLGGTRVLRADVRIVAATNRDLKQAIANGQFREDLYYRLNVFPIRLPALRARRADILPLSDAFLAEIGRGLERAPQGLSREARTMLMAYQWPGNVRELRNTIERAAILCDGGPITADHLGIVPATPPATMPLCEPEASHFVHPSCAGDLQSMERAMISQALHKARFNKSKAAKALGLTRHQLYVRMRKYGLLESESASIVDFARRIAVCLVLASLIPAMAAAQSVRSSSERLSLDTAIRLATENNRQLQSARLQVQKAESDVAAARTRRLPIFETEVTSSQLMTPVSFAFPQGAFGEFPGTGPIPAVDTKVSVPRQPTVYISSQVSQPLTQLFRIGLGIRSASTTREIELERVRAQQLSVVNNVKRLYFAILQTESAITASEDALALYRELDRTLQVRVTQKVALRADALDVQFQLAQEELTLTTGRNSLESQKEQLNQLLGRDVRTPFAVEDVSEISLLDIDVDAARTQALESRPDVKEARLKVQQADLDRRLTKADRIPEVSLAVSYVSNFNIDILPANLATLGVSVKWEPFDWGRKSHEVAAKIRTVEQARLNLRDAEDRTVLEINSRFRTLAEKRALLNVARMAQTTAREKLRVKTNQFQVQAVLLPDVLQVRAELADADDRVQQALLGFWTAKADYDLATGQEVIR